MVFTRLLKICSLALTLTIPAVVAQVSEFSLANGMKVIVKEDHRAPVVVSQVWYKVGSSYEPDGITGISHALEHMMFKGTDAVGPGQFARTVSALGGDENAFTSRDYTAYFETLATEHLEKALELEADRMRGLLLDPAEFAKEIEVVKEERRLRTEDKPSGKVYEQFNAVAWRASPYRNPVIGWMNDLDHLTIDDLRGWYRRWYAPNNATLVVVGDVQPEQVRMLAERHFGGIEVSEMPSTKPAAEPAQTGETRVEVKVPARQPYLLMGYKTPIVGTAAEKWEPYALYVLANVLDGGNSARLSRELVRGSGVAASAGAEYGPYSRLPGMFVLDGTPTDGHSTAELEQALRAQVGVLREDLIDDTELKRIVTQAVASKVYQADSLFYQAMEIGTLETIGLDWRLIKTEIDAIRAVTPEQVRSVAQRYLVDDNLTVATLVPLPMDQKPTRPALPGVRDDS
ncbi:MAG: insulinase family protein [Chromatiaceae bacterium]|nr:insulinase family protein [Chromatiaceae bacterium]MCP5422183.1 insulinase family protein [Chromatiaceae bacterium]